MATRATAERVVPVAPAAPVGQVPPTFPTVVADDFGLPSACRDDCTCCGGGIIQGNEECESDADCPTAGTASAPEDTEISTIVCCDGSDASEGTDDPTASFGPSAGCGVFGMAALLLMIAGLVGLKLDRSRLNGVPKK